MKSLVKAINKRKHILFIDLEGTQFSHEMIALGAVKVDLDYKFRVKKIYKGIKFYVKSVGPIGHFVQDLTGITPELLSSDGLPLKLLLSKSKNIVACHLRKWHL